MNYTLVLDSSAALPEFLLKKRPIKMLPITVRINDDEFPDILDQRKLIEMYDSDTLSTSAKIDVISPTQELISNFILEQVAPEYDFAICQTLAKTVSPIYDNLSDVANQISKRAREVRTNKLQPFRMTYMSTGTTVAGQGLLGFYADIMLSKGMEYSQYKLQIEKFKTVAKGYLVVKDMVYARHRTKMRGVKTVALPIAVIGKLVGLSPIALNHNEKLDVVAMPTSYEKSANVLFKYAAERIKEGLYFNALNITIAGNPDDLENFHEFRNLKKVANDANVKLLIGVMALAASINCGPGTIGIGIAPKNLHKEPG